MQLSSRLNLWLAGLVGSALAAALAGLAAGTFIAELLPQPSTSRRPSTTAQTADETSEHAVRALMAGAPGRSSGAGGGAPAIESGVRKVGVRRYEVRRALVDDLLAGGLTPPWPRVVPQTRAGQPLGLRLFGIHPGSPFAAIGLESGDLLREVNGRSIATPDAALATSAALRSATRARLVIERDGEVVRLDYVLE